MIGMSVSDFMNKVYYGNELEFVIDETTYFIQGFKVGGKFNLTVDYWKKTDGTEPNHDYLFSISCDTIEDRFSQFEQAHIFDGKTVYEAESKIEVLYG